MERVLKMAKTEKKRTSSKKPIYLVWCAVITNDKILYFLRSVTTSKKLAELHAKTVEYENKMMGEERRIVRVEPSLSNHLYAQNDLEVAGYRQRAGFYDA
jgi:hypothetical protein